MVLERAYQKTLEIRLKEKAPLIQVVVGPRQVGKTTAATQIYNKWKYKKIIASADSPTPPGPEWIEWHWQKALDSSPDCLLIFDEIQKVQGWSEQIKILFDRERGKGNLKIVLLGSSSLYLQKGLSESLAGRFELIEAPHWSFSEFNTHFKWNFEKYITFGAYPGSTSISKNKTRWDSYILNSIIEPVLGRDIMSSHPINNPPLFRQTFELAMNYPSQIISYQKLLGQLHDKGNAATIKHYLKLFENSFLIKCLEKYSGSQIKVKSSSPKILILNPALANAYKPLEALKSNSKYYNFLFESIIGTHLSFVPGCKLYYWKKGNFEVDYIIESQSNITAIEIKSGLKKSGKGLKEFSKTYPNAKCLLWDYKNCMNFIKTKKSIF